MRVLLIDDDSKFRVFAEIALSEANIQHDSAPSAEAGLAKLEESEPGTFDLILLDVQMPDLDGWGALTRLRESGNDIPVIYVSGIEHPQQRVRGLRLGADDYLVKPVEFDELIARIEAVLRRRNSLAPMHIGDLEINLAQRTVRRAGKACHLSPKEFDLVVALVRAEGEVLSREQLLKDVWDIEFDPGTNVLDVHIGRTRKKVERPDLTPLIETVRGKGYRIRSVPAS